MSKSVVLSLSGGMDSATLLGKAVDQELDIYVVSFVYGSKHNHWETEAANALVHHYARKIKIARTINLTEVFSQFKSSLLKGGPDLPHGHYEAESMKQTVVPGRNLIFLSILAGYAQSLEVGCVWMGMHTGDHSVYADCRPGFVGHAQQTVLKSSEGMVNLKAPFLMKNKTSIIQEGLEYSMPVPYKKTRTCYSPNQKACGKCGSCQERLAAFAEVGIEDPIQYETRAILPRSP